MKAGLVSLFLIPSLMLASVPLAAQSNYAVLGGSVIDPQEHPIPQADVRLTAVSTQVERQVVSNDQGIFQITGLLPGEYKMTIFAPGFAPPGREVQLSARLSF